MTGDLFAEALKAHTAGDLTAAERLYQQVLEADPRHSQACSNLATVWLQQGRWDDGIAGLRQSLGIDPAQPFALNNLGLALRGLGRTDEAIDAFRRAAAADTSYADPRVNLAGLLESAGRLEEAATAYGDAAKIHPEPGPLRHAQGLLLYRLGRFDDAAGPLRQAIELQPAAPAPLNDLGVALEQGGRLQEALEAYGRALALRPDYAEAMNNRALALVALDRPLEALGDYDAALRLKPGYAAAWMNRADALAALGRFEEALASLDQALVIDAGYVEAWVRRGDMLGYLRRIPEAEAAYAKALQLDPANARASFHLAFPLLREGRYEEGLKIYERRWNGPLKDAVVALPQPLWLGDQPVEGKTLLLHSEQGLGDTLMMLRYAPLLARRGATVIVSVQAPLETLAAAVEGVSAVVPHGQPLPPYDLHTPMMSLPLAFGTRPDTIPGEPYLRAPEADRAKWARRLGPRTRPRVGLCWAGSPTHKDDRWRSLPLRGLAALAHLGADLYAVQPELRPGDETVMHDLGVTPLGSDLRDYADTAGLIENLDLVITVDTSLTNLAGGLGRPMFVMLGAIADWRWGLDPVSTPWYPSARLFRQDRIGAWEAVVAEVRAAAQQRLNSP